MKVLLTGANGFIGRAVTARLLDEGIAVRAAVRAEAVIGSGIERATIGDLGPQTDWRAAIDGCSHVVHLAGRAHVMRDAPNADVAAFRRVNTVGTLALADAAARAGVKRFVFVSSIGVLGRTSLRPFTEADAPRPRDPYAQAKLEAERGLAERAARGDLEIVTVRPPLVYGLAAPGNLARLARLVRRGWPLPFGAIRNRRTLVGVDSLADLLARALFDPAAAGEVFHAGDATDVSIAEIVTFLAEGMGLRPRLVPVAPPLLRVPTCAFGRSALYDRLCADLQVDASKARRVLGWRAEVSTSEGLRAVGRSYVALSA